MKRFEALDFLRGISIFGMVFSAIIPYGVLPVWMYHIQTPPPSHAVDLTLTGLSWVDLVFPVFIFCMGVAIPLSGRKKISAAAESGRGDITKTYITGTLERFLMLWLFSYLYIVLNYGSVESFWAQLLTIAGFLSLFPIYMIIKNTKYKTLIRVTGFVAAAVIIWAGHTFFGEVVSIHRSGIIIFLLAFLYLFSSLIWFFTRDNIRARILIFLLLLAFSSVAMHFHLAQKIYTIESVRWIVNLEYIYFLLILLPATWFGDLLAKDNDGSAFPSPGAGFAFTSLFLMIWMCYAFYMRLFVANFIVSALILAVMYFYVKRKMKGALPVFITAALFLLAGVIVDPVEGGIQKSPATISYCFVSYAAGIFLLWVASYLCKIKWLTFVKKIFTGAGGNPLMSYVAFNNFMIPLFKITGLIFVYKVSYPDANPWLGVLSAAFYVLLMMSGTSLLTHKKVVWRA
jgi:hypothetical protein